MTYNVSSSQGEVISMRQASTACYSIHDTYISRRGQAQSAHHSVAADGVTDTVQAS